MLVFEKSFTTGVNFQYSFSCETPPLLSPGCLLIILSRIPPVVFLREIFETLKTARKFFRTKVLYISDRCCTEFNIYYFISQLLLAINDSIFKLMMLIESGILLKNIQKLQNTIITENCYIQSCDFYMKQLLKMFHCEFLHVFNFFLHLK